MLSSLIEVTIYKVYVKPTACLGWSGQFDFEPNGEDVATAIRMDIVRERGCESIDVSEIEHLNNALDLVTLRSLELPANVRVAGMSVGSISISSFEVFVREVESAMPPLHPQTTLTQEVKQ